MFRIFGIFYINERFASQQATAQTLNNLSDGLTVLDESLQQIILILLQHQHLSDFCGFLKVRGTGEGENRCIRQH